MKKKLLVGMVAVGLLLTGCGKQTEEETDVSIEETQVEEKAEEIKDEPEMEVELSEWNGEWNSVDEFIDDDFATISLEEVASREGISIEEARDLKLSELEFPYGSMEISGDEIIFNDGLLDNKTKVIKAKYAYKESVPMEHAGGTYFWHVFETEEDSLDKYLLLMDVHGEETLAHFHARMGKDIEELVAMEDYYPTFVRPDADQELIAEEIAE